MRKEKETRTEAKRRRTGVRWSGKKQMKMYEAERTEGGALLDSPPLGLIFFCILCCV